MMTDEHGDGWDTWAKRVLGDIERIDNQNKTILNELSNIRVDIAILKTKAALIGGAWGTVMGIITAIIIKLIGRS